MRSHFIHRTTRIPRSGPGINMEPVSHRFSSLIAETTSRGPVVGRPLLVTRFYECGLQKRIVGGTVADETGGENGVESVDQYLDSARAQRRFRLAKIPVLPNPNSNIREIYSRISSSSHLVIIPRLLVSFALRYFAQGPFSFMRFKTT